MGIQRDKIKVFNLFQPGKNESMVTFSVPNEPVKKAKLLMQERGAQIQVGGKDDDRA